MKRKYIWLIEIIVWLLIISGGLFLFIYKTAVKDNVQNTYYIFFDDVDDFIVVSADGLHDADLNKIVKSHKESGCIATMAIVAN